MMHGIFTLFIFCLLICFFGTCDYIPDFYQNKPSTGDITSYSIAHLSDTQNMATFFPELYEITFSYLDSIRESNNISAIIITGDLVNTWNDKSEWDAYSNAVHKTSIPVYTVSGNHDTNWGNNNSYYSMYTGDQNSDYIIPINDFNLLGINYVENSLKQEEITRLKKLLLEAPHPFTIIATHFYMDKNGTSSLLGEDIDRELITTPAIIMTGHMHANIINLSTINGYPVIRDMTVSQSGLTWIKNTNYTAGILYNISVKDGSVEKISSENIQIYPDPMLSEERILYENPIKTNAYES